MPLNPCIEDSIADHSAYLLGAMNGKKLRYNGLKGCKDYKKDSRSGLGGFAMVADEPKAAEPAVKVPFLVKVSISDLNTRKGPGIDYDRVKFILVGVYTIMEVRSGKGNSARWGRLKSGIGWISLDFVKRL